ncbi:neprilysin-2 [Dermacentor silvarum]|uniref:neprilysin-2 n=1 Tax=Dermacentor silvarum TaxID=543639 RepID=UPI002101012B|nr:neprilysin-2 [Dermacentor silvarum]
MALEVVRVRYRAHAGQQPKRPVPPADSGECVSRVCLWNRNYLFRSSFSKPSPCEDFYEHACADFRNSPGGFAQQPYPRWSTGQLLLDFDMFFMRFLAIKGRQPRPIESNFLVQAILSSIFKTPDYETAVANYVGLKALITLSPFMPPDYRTLYEFGLGSDIDHFDTQLAACSVLLEKMYRYGVGIAAKLTSNREFANVYRTHHDDQLAALFNKMRVTIRDMLQSRRSWFSQDDIATAQRKLENMTFVFGTQDNFVQYEDYRRTPTLALKSNESVLETVFAIFSHASSIYWSALGNGAGGNVTAAYDNAYTASVFEWGSEYQPTNNLVFAPNGLVGFLSTISSTIPFQLYPAVVAPLLKASLQALLRSNSLFDDRMLPRKWWSAESVGAYENVTQCLRRQYEAAENASSASNATSWAPSRFSVARLEEDFLDNAVLWPLYELYEQALIEYNATRLYYALPFVHVSTREMFFYNYAWLFCDKAIASSRKLQQSLGMSPAKLRLNVALSNFPPFLKTFSCMAKKQQRCEVWKQFA